jgi:hypothetical protein
MPDDADNILQVAVNRLLKGVRPKQVQGIFAAQNAITASPAVAVSVETGVAVGLGVVGSKFIEISYGS